MMKAFSLLLGAPNAGRQRGRFRRADETRLRAITAEHFPAGFSVLNVSGGWYDPAAQRFIVEESRQILVTANQRGPVRRWALALATAFGQQEVVVVESGRAFRWKIAPGKVSA